MMGVHMDSPSAERNKPHIWGVILSNILPKFQNSKSLQILEIAAGAGVHSIYFTENILSSLPNTKLTWISSDPDINSLASVQARTQSHSNGELQSAMVLPPKKLTLVKNGFLEKIDFQENQTDLMICINMIHISPWDATLGLMKEASNHLKPKTGYLYCYGPYLEGGTGAISNVQFNESLKSRNPQWGVRNVEDVIEVAEKNGLVLEENIPMPRENMSLIFRKL